MPCNTYPCSPADLAMLLDEQAWSRGEVLRQRVLHHGWVGGERDAIPTNLQPKFDLVRLTVCVYHCNIS